MLHAVFKRVGARGMRVERTAIAMAIIQCTSSCAAISAAARLRALGAHSRSWCDTHKVRLSGVPARARKLQRAQVRTLVKVLIVLVIELALDQRLGAGLLCRGRLLRRVVVLIL
jgi:hypothetical protein